MIYTDIYDFFKNYEWSLLYKIEQNIFSCSEIWDK